jgi:c-di-GMP-binding flagellar brake protein YcgR
VRLYYARFQDFIEVVTENISETGMYIHGTGIQPVGVTFEFALLLTDGFSLIEGTAEVMWVSFGEHGRTDGMGVRFVELAEESA